MAVGFDVLAATLGPVPRWVLPAKATSTRAMAATTMISSGTTTGAFSRTRSGTRRRERDDTVRRTAVASPVMAPARAVSIVSTSPRSAIRSSACA